MLRRVFVTVEKAWGTGAVAEDRKEPKTEPDAKKDKEGAKPNEREAAGEAPILSEEPLTTRSENFTRWQISHTAELLLERGWASSLD